jgi:SAM-dependent methyltransferase
MVEIANDLAELYDGYFPDNPWESKKNALAARDSVDAIVRLAGSTLGSVVDVGAGDGVVTREIHDRKVASRITALEISSSGIRKIESLGIASAVARFDGYSIPFGDKAFDTAVCSHVVEHVERIARRCVFVVPLEGGLRGRIDRRMGHINYYSPLTFRNLIETSNLRVLGESVFSCSSDYEKHLAGKFKGGIRATIRRANALAFGPVAPHFMNYIMAIHCEST